MARNQLPQALIDVPSFLCENFKGYEHYTDPTVMDFNKLTFPSKNCTMPSFDKVVPDKGKTLYGQIFNEDVGMVGNKQKFKNAGGIEMEIRVFQSGSATLKDVIEAGYLNNRMVFTVTAGVLTVGESISGQTSGASAIIDDKVGTVLFLSNIIGDFVVGETILGLTSGAIATTVLVPVIFFQSLTELTNPIPRGAHEYYFDSWFDTKLPNSIANSTTSKNMQRCIWVNGYQDPSTKKGAVYSWTGGIGIITSFVVNTSISCNPATTWRSLGFTEDASGAVNIIVNGITHNIPVPADIDTSTLNIASTAGMAIGDTVTSKIEVDVAPIVFDVCRAVKGYMYYGGWRHQQLYQSNEFNREFSYSVVSFQALDNDLIVKPSLASPYTGTIEELFHIVIDSINPPVNEQVFIPSTGSLNDGVFNTAGYVGAVGVTNIYKVAMLADFTLVTGIIGGVYSIGETITQIQTATSTLATGVVIAVLPGVSYSYGIRMTSAIGFNTTDNVVGSSTTFVNPVVQALYQNWIQYSKNNVVVNINNGSGSIPITPLNTSLTTLSDGLTIQFANFQGHGVGDVFQLTMDQGGHDTFSWQVNGGALTTGVAITGALQTLSEGVQIQFNGKTGHQVGDYWDVLALPGVTRAFDNFYYALPVRKIGEGYIYNLPSNFWTMDTQEDSMYVNCSYGEWGAVTTTLSADLLSESVAYTPLKQTGANKVLYPYLTGHINDDLIYINIDHQLDTLGRLPLLEKPQTGYLSDPVRLDFEESSFVGGRIKYINKRLYISSPENGVTHCYDTFKKYWQTPKTFIEVGLLSIIGNDLVCHSNIRNQTFTMFTSASGDNGAAYEVIIRTPYWSGGNKWSSKFSNMSFTEGYITGAPKLIYTVYEGVNGCGGIFPHPIDPVICLAPDRAPFGEGSFGSHPNGSDLDAGGSYFNEINKAYKPTLQYYLIALDISCIAKSHTYSILSLGMNGMWSESGNNTLVAPSNLVQP